MKTNADTSADNQRQLEFMLVPSLKLEQTEMFEQSKPPEPSEHWFTAPRAKGRGRVLLPPKHYKK